MRKVKEYLDKNFFHKKDIKTEEKNNGQLGIFGDYHYPENIEKKWSSQYNMEFEDNFILLSFNNETVITRVVYKGKFINKYHYLQTYLHLPYRWTDEQVIEYIVDYKKTLDKHKLRKERIKKLLTK